jgi:maltokinase-like protein
MTIHVGATLTPPFPEFLPPWVARQPWYRGTSVPALALVGSFRFEDPAGQVGLETHLVTDGSDLYQIPMTYRGAPTDGPALVAKAEHSVLGTRWIYDGQTDPLWHERMLHLVRTGGVSDPSGRQGPRHAEARGEQLVPGPLTADSVRVEPRRVLTPGTPALPPDAVGMVMGTWYPDGPGTTAVSGFLAVVVPV